MSSLICMYVSMSYSCMSLSMLSLIYVSDFPAKKGLQSKDRKQMAQVQ